MKQIKIIIVLFFSSFVVHSQTDSSKVEKKIVKFNERFRFGFFRPIPLGNNTYAKDIKPIIGLNTRLSILSIYDFNLGAGVDFGFYSIKRPENIGTFKNGKTLAFHFEINRDIKINSNIKLIPFLDLGQNNLTFKEKGVKIMRQNGNSFKIGCLTNFKIDKTASYYLGLEYSSVKYDIKTIPELEDYFNRSKQIVFLLGINLN